MVVSQLFSIYPQYHIGESPTKEVKNICFDSRQVNETSVFVALVGERHDGHDFLPQVVAQNPAGIVVQDRNRVPSSFKGAVVQVKNSRWALSALAKRFYAYPAEDLFCVGITGTNGKTSTAYMVEQIFHPFGWKTGVMGTIDHHLEERQWESELTTPDAVQLFKRLAEFKSLGAGAAVFEVSSHAIEQSRVEGIPFNSVVFTNLSRDHLDYHGSMEEYFNAKERLFRDLISSSNKKEKFAIINADDEWGQKIVVADEVRKWTYGQKEADFQFKTLKSNFSGSYFKIETPRGSGEGFLPIPGRVFLYNAVAAIAVSMGAGVSLELALQSLGQFKGVPGRLQAVENSKDFHIFVDYAHTPDALKNVLHTLCEIRGQESQESNIVCVFGCGGDRDKGKRPLMMEAALEFSDMVFVTSDNPRTEDPQVIIDDIIVNLDADLIDRKVFIEVHREKAIQRAIRSLKPKDVLLVAGKGHEDYQILGTEKISFCDSEKVKEALIGL